MLAGSCWGCSDLAPGEGAGEGGSSVVDDEAGATGSDTGSSAWTGTSRTSDVDSASTDAETTASPPQPQVPTCVGAWGEYGTEPGQFIEPSSVEIDLVGDVYVAGHEDRLQKFSPEGELIAIFGVAGVGLGEFDHPHGLAMDRAQGLLFAGDQENNRVQVLTTDGDFPDTITDPLFAHIHDVGIDLASGAIFVGDLESNVVQKYDAAGTLLASFGSTGTGPVEFSGVWGMSTDATGRVFVADSGNARVQVLTADGRYLDQWTGFTKPTGVYVDALGTVYVCDSLEDDIVVHDPDGNVVDTWNLAAIVGTDSEPEDIVISADGVHIYVADVLQHRVVHLQRTG